MKNCRRLEAKNEQKVSLFSKGSGGAANSWFEISKILKIWSIWGDNGQIGGEFLCTQRYVIVELLP